MISMSPVAERMRTLCSTLWFDSAMLQGFVFVTETGCPWRRFPSQLVISLNYFIDLHAIESSIHVARPEQYK